VGETAKVKADSKKREAKFNGSDPTISLGAQDMMLKEEVKAEFDRALPQRSGRD
jgi:hypothetical protein